MCGTTDKYKGQVRYVLKYTTVIGHCDPYYNTEVASSIRKKVIKSTWYDGSDDTKPENLSHTMTDNYEYSENNCFKTYEEALDYAVKHNTEVIDDLQRALNKAMMRKVKQC